MIQATFFDSNIPKSRKATRVPGDTLRVTLEQAKDSEGRTWPAGSEFRPLSGGYNNLANAREAVCTMLGDPLPHCNDAQGWDDLRYRQGYSGSHH